MTILATIEHEIRRTVAAILGHIRELATGFSNREAGDYLGAEDDRRVPRLTGMLTEIHRDATWIHVGDTVAHDRAPALYAWRSNLWCWSTNGLAWTVSADQKNGRLSASPGHVWVEYLNPFRTSTPAQVDSATETPRPVVHQPAPESVSAQPAPLSGAAALTFGEIVSSVSGLAVRRASRAEVEHALRVGLDGFPDEWVRDVALLLLFEFHVLPK